MIAYTRMSTGLLAVRDDCTHGPRDWQVHILLHEGCELDVGQMLANLLGHRVYGHYWAGPMDLDQRLVAFDPDREERQEAAG